MVISPSFVGTRSYPYAMLAEVTPLIMDILLDTLGPPTTWKPPKAGGAKRSPLALMEKVTSRTSPVPIVVLFTDAVNFTCAKTRLEQHSSSVNMESLIFISIYKTTKIYQSFEIGTLAPFNFLFFSLSWVCFSSLLRASSIRWASSFDNWLGCCPC